MTMPCAPIGCPSTRSILPLTTTPGPSSNDRNETSRWRGTSGRHRCRLVANELLEVTLEPLLELAPVEIVRFDAQAGRPPRSATHSRISATACLDVRLGVTRSAPGTALGS